MPTNLALSTRPPATPLGGEVIAARDRPDQPPLGGAAEVVRRRSDVTLAFVSQGVSSATNFLRLVFVARLCTEEAVGVYALGLTVAMLMVALNERLVESPYTVYTYRRSGAAAKSLLGSAGVFSLAAVLLGSLATVVAALVIYFVSPQSGLCATLLAVALIAPAVVLREFARSASFTHFRMRSALMIDIATLVIQALLLWMLWGAGLVTVVNVYLVVALSCVIPVAVWAWAWSEHWSLDPQRIRGDWKELWSFSRWLVAARIMGNGSRLVIPWLVFAVMNEAAAGRLAVCLGLVGLAWLFVRGLNTFFRPFIVHSYARGGAAAARRAVLVTALAPTLLLAPVFLLFAVAGDWMLVSIYGESLRGAQPLLLILTANTLATSWAIAAAIGLMAVDRPSDNLWVEGLTLVVTVIAALPLILQFGLVGAALAMLLGNLAGVISAFYLFESRLSSAPVQETQHA